MKNLKQAAIRSVFAKLSGEVVGFILRLVSVVTLARLLDPKDFGLVAMVFAVTNVYGIFTTGGLSTATIQKATITDEQISTLFWINVLVGTVLALLCLLTAPLLVWFYDEPRLFWITAIAAAGFIFCAAGVQHVALLERQLRYGTMTVIERSCQLVSLIISITMALSGFGYWALLVAPAIWPALTTLCAWLITSWVPGPPRRRAGIGSMLHFGGTVTLNSLVVYIAYNLDKVLLGRFWGANALGLYGRAYDLINIPTATLNASVGTVAFSALSRLQNDPLRLRNYFLKAYSLVNSLTLPTATFCALFADDIILLALGPKWTEAIPILRLLAPTILVFGMINPTGWLLLSVGLQGRSLRIALVIAPLVTIAYVIGLPYGPTGVALSYSAAMTAWLVPHILWCSHGTVVSPRDLFLAIARPLLSAGIAAAVAFWAHSYFTDSVPRLLRFLLDAGVMAIVYYTMLLFVLGQRALYLDLIRELMGSPSQGKEGGGNSAT